MIEGQEDVTWADWLALAGACEEHGVEALFRSDHYLSVEGKTARGSLDAWATIAALAAVTDRLRLGTLVSPATFRHPSELAKVVTTVDHVSGGRVELGMGTGWLEAEHNAYGFPFPPLAERFAELEEQLELVSREWAGGPFSSEGRRYKVRDLDALPKPLQRPRPHLIVGGRGGRRSVAVGARFAELRTQLLGRRHDLIAVPITDPGEEEFSPEQIKNAKDVDAKFVDAGLEKAREWPLEETVVYTEYRIVRPDTGETRWMARRGEILRDDDGTWTVQGDPTDAAFLVAERKLGITGQRRARFRRVGEVPFTSERKLMSTVHSDAERQERLLAFTKGAPDVLLGRCSHELVGSEIRSLTAERRPDILKVNEELAGEALRTLGVAFRALPRAGADPNAFDEGVEWDLVFLGLILEQPRHERQAHQHRLCHAVRSAAHEPLRLPRQVC